MRNTFSLPFLLSPTLLLVPRGISKEPSLIGWFYFLTFALSYRGFAWALCHNSDLLLTQLVALAKHEKNPCTFLAWIHGTLHVIEQLLKATQVCKLLAQLIPLSHRDQYILGLKEWNSYSGSV